MKKAHGTHLKSIYPIGIKRALIPFEHNGKWGYFDQEGNVVVRPLYDDADAFSEGLAGVRISDFWGYINEEGSVVVTPEYHFVGPYVKGQSIVKNSKGYFLIDQSGVQIKTITGDFEIDEPIEQAASHGEWIKIQHEERFGYINFSGNIVIPPQYVESGTFSNGLAWVKSDHGRYSFIDSSGTTTIGLPDHIIPDSFSEGMAAVRDIHSLKSGFIDTNGQLIIAINLSNPDSFSEGLTTVIINNGKMGYIDLQGHFVIEGAYDEALPFINGTALVSIGDKSGFIDKNGDLVVPMQQFDYIDVQSYFLNSSVVLVMQDGKYKYINRHNGKTIFEIQ
ncbi:WG repeat-containing protein [Cohnella boryungensis]|uniref:WG repeat-containing protein n=1 Tax=Cohnella boryungensis TaxID=768479 RepID=A0ABV8SEG9_9BACL